MRFVFVFGAIVVAIMFLNVEEKNYTIQTTDVKKQVELKAMDKLMAEDLTLTTQLFLKQLSVQMQRWAETDLSDQHLRAQFEDELNEHPHFHGFAIVDNGKVVEKVGSIKEYDPNELTHRHMNSLFSDPYVADGEHYMLMGEKLKDGRTVLGEIKLSFVKTFIKDIATVADSNGSVFLTNNDAAVEWKTTEDIPEDLYSQTVPELGWQIAIHSKDEVEEIKRPFHEQQAVIKFARPNQAERWFSEHPELTIIDQHGPLLIVESQNETTEQLISRLRKDNRLAIVEPNYIISNQVITMTTVPEEVEKTNVKSNESARTPVEPNDELFSPYQWNLKQIDADKGWNLANGEDVTIAILDTGVDPNHQDLKDKIIGGYNAVNDTDDFSDNHGHGTHVAGIAAALTNNITGIAGVSWQSYLLPVKVLNESGEGSSYEVAKGIYWAVDNGADVINMSLGDYNHSNILYDAVKYAYDRNVILVSATGNDNVEQPMYPSIYEEVLAVAAVDEARNRAFFSNYGAHVDVTAPGEHVPSSFPNNNYVVMSGTSMAAPHVAGLAALIRSLRPDLTNEQVYEIIIETSNDLGTTGHDPYYGHGEINIEKALEVIQP